MAFLSTAGTLWLYSGVRNRYASPAATVELQRRRMASELPLPANPMTPSCVSPNIGSRQSRRSRTSTTNAPCVADRSTSQGRTRSAARPARVLPTRILSSRATPKTVGPQADLRSRTEPGGSRPPAEYLYTQVVAEGDQ